MKRAIITFLLAPLLLASSAMAQRYDWKNVQMLPNRTKIKVQLKQGHTFGHCFVTATSDNALICSTRGGPFGLWSRRLVYPRDNVKAVYLAHDGTLIGAAVGAGTGAVIGAAKPGCCRGANALIGAGLMAMPGMVVGTALDPFFHGRAVYRSSSDHTQNRGSSPTATGNANLEDVKIRCLRDGVTLQCVNR
jgi:hypothetical protein